MAHPLLHLRILLPFLYNCILCPLPGTIVSQVGISERNVPYPTQLAFEDFFSEDSASTIIFTPWENKAKNCRFYFLHSLL